MAVAVAAISGERFGGVDLLCRCAQVAVVGGKGAIHRAERAVRLDRDAIAELYTRDQSAHLVVLVASTEANHDCRSRCRCRRP